MKLPNNAYLQVADLSQDLANALLGKDRLVYESFEIIREGRDCTLKYDFHIGDHEHFEPSAVIHLPATLVEEYPEINDRLEAWAFHVGMIEAISYWKCACPQHFEVRCGTLDTASQDWWLALMRRGLAEFFYTNGIEVSSERCVDFILQGNSRQLTHRASQCADSSVLVPVGGGKDSLLTLCVLQEKGVDVIPFLINPGAASLAMIEHLGLSERYVRITRRLDPRLLKLNGSGYFNGHTPFSACIAFYAGFTASSLGFRWIALSNESSADEPSVGTVNHQYTKTTEFEQDFRAYVERVLAGTVDYFSYLRPLNELQIADHVSRYPEALATAVSCNRHIEAGRWCGRCPKCLSSALLLLPFAGEVWLESQFPHNPLDDLALWNTFETLIGVQPEKPFECVPARLDLTCALALLRNKRPHLLERYALLRCWKTRDFPACATEAQVQERLHEFNSQHCVPPSLCLKPSGSECG